jgi:MFS family permease
MTRRAESVAVTAPSSPATAAATTPDSLWRHADFMKLWTGETVSVFGSQVTELALPLVAILTLNAGPGQLGLLNGAKFLPFVLLSLFAGVWIDRWRRRPVLIGANIGRAVLIGLVPLSAALGLLSIKLLYVVAFLGGMLTVLFDLAYLSYLPSLIPRTRLIDGNGKLQASQSLAGIGGPGLAGLLVQLLTAPIALLVDALSYLVSAASLLSIRQREPAPDSGTGDGAWRQEIAEGLRAVFGNPYLRALAGQAATFNLFEDLVLTVFLLYGIRELDLGPAMIGLVFGAGSAGAFLGSMAGRHATRVAGLGTVLIAAGTIACLSPLLFLFAHGPDAPSVAVLAGALLVHGVSVAVGNVNAVALRQSITPNRLLGRMNASYRLLTYGAIPLGSLLGGALASAFGIRMALVTGLACLPLAVSWLVFSPVMRLRDLSDAAVN